MRSVFFGNVEFGLEISVQQLSSIHLRILHHLSLVLSSVHDSETKLKSKGIKKCPAYIKEVSHICQTESGIIFQIFCLKLAVRAIPPPPPPCVLLFNHKKRVCADFGCFVRIFGIFMHMHFTRFMSSFSQAGRTFVPIYAFCMSAIELSWTKCQQICSPLSTSP